MLSAIVLAEPRTATNGQLTELRGDLIGHTIKFLITGCSRSLCCCGRSMKNCGVRTIGVMTTCGEVIVHRRRYRCRCQDCQHEVHPADARLCCGRHRVSRPLAKPVCQLALVATQHGVTLCHETILELAPDVGGAAERRRLAEARSRAARREPPPSTDTGTPAGIPSPSKPD